MGNLIEECPDGATLKATWSSPSTVEHTAGVCSPSRIDALKSRVLAFQLFVLFRLQKNKGTETGIAILSGVCDLSAEFILPICIGLPFVSAGIIRIVAKQCTTKVHAFHVGDFDPVHFHLNTPKFGGVH